MYFNGRLVLEMRTLNGNEWFSFETQTVGKTFLTDANKQLPILSMCTSFYLISFGISHTRF